MATDNDSVRADFQAAFPVPFDAIYNAQLDQYCWDNYPRNTHPFNGKYEAWQASRERYVPRWISVEERLPSGGELLIVAETDDYPHLGTTIVPARYNCTGVWSDIDCVDCDGDERQLLKVTRWMEISQPTPNGGN